MAITKHDLPLVLSMGEPAGIAGEISLRAWQYWQNQNDSVRFFVHADVDYLRNTAKKLGSEYKIATIDKASEANKVFASALPVLPLTNKVNATSKMPDISNNAAVIESIQASVELCLSGQAKALITNPIHKAILKQGGFAHQGHTDYLAHLCQKNPRDAVMMLASDELRVVPITVHVPLKQVAKILSAELIKNTARTTITSLQTLFGIKQPTIYVAGLNPHAGEQGKIGHEETSFINASINELKDEGLNVYGTFAADSLFTPNMRQKYDAALCMYHDQALIPIKTLAFDKAVNITLGLPIIRTSPDHGTAIDIANQNKASPTSLIAAIKIAHNMHNMTHKDK